MATKINGGLDAQSHSVISTMLSPQQKERAVQQNGSALSTPSISLDSLDVMFSLRLI